MPGAWGWPWPPPDSDAVEMACGAYIHFGPVSLARSRRDTEVGAEGLGVGHGALGTRRSRGAERVQP